MTTVRREHRPLFTRHPANPLLTPARWPYPINAVLNAGAAEVDGTTVLLCRVEDRRGISHLAVARSNDGISNWVVDDEPLLQPDPAAPHEEWGLEDPRLTWVPNSRRGRSSTPPSGPADPASPWPPPATSALSTSSGMVRAPEDKNGALLPRRVNGRYILLHRPVTALTARADIWLSRSTDLKSGARPSRCWRPGPVAGGTRPGSASGPPPLETEAGWLLVYHGVRQTVAGALYRVGLAMLDLEDPTRVTHRCGEWVLGPAETYELVGDVPGVVFPCGLVHDAETDELRLYYGAADTCVAVATSTLSEVLDYVQECG